eukprot:TRINITY_DN11668_c0_g1_i1.p1 TRINITY_DN11668_c0_g1~~TRINITY_DN11668_c0_g1_i1.p1  ORF type:complete len:448 (-),score=57.94 TRINITY_DN11668_c0_g1_i1:1-1344(-)
MASWVLSRHLVNNTKRGSLFFGRSFGSMAFEKTTKRKRMKAVELLSFGSRQRNVVDTMDHSVGIPFIDGQESYAGKDPAFSVADVEMPQPVGTEVLVEVHAASVNPIDCMMARGYGKDVFFASGRRFGLGRDFSGKIVDVGSSAWRFRIGDEVYGAVHPFIQRREEREPVGSYSQYVMVRQDQIALKPKILSHAESASLPFSSLTAWQSFLRPILAHLKPEEDVIFIHGGSGVIGSFAIQIAKAKGFKVWTSCSRRNSSYVESLGVDGWVDYHQTTLVDSSAAGNYHEETNKKHLDRGVPRGSVSAVLDVVGTEATKRFSTEILRSAPIALSCPFANKDKPFYVTLRPPVIPLIDRYGVGLGAAFSLKELLSSAVTNATGAGAQTHWGIYSDMHNNGETLRQIAKLADRGVIKPHIDTIFNGLESVAQGHTLLESGKACGKVVLKLL